MKEKIDRWIKAERLKLLLTFSVLILGIILIMILRTTYIVVAQYINTIFLFVSLGFMSVLLIVNYIKVKKISLILLFGIIVNSMIYYLGSNSVNNICLLWIRAVLFLSTAALGLIVVWIAKTRMVKNFSAYLMLSLLTVILNFGGFYESLYSMYFRYDLEAFKIEQGMSYSQSIMPIDFIYYSGDAFFGTDISDVRIKYIDYIELSNKESKMSKHIDKYESATKIVQIAKLVSFLESM